MSRASRSPDVPERLPHPPAENPRGEPDQRDDRRTSTSASRQSITSIIPMMAIRVKTSPKMVTTPDENSSFSVSTSEVTRVISRPTGLRSK